VLAGPDFQALTPDSGLWLEQIDRQWLARQTIEEGQIAPRLVGESTRYAISPIVIAAWDNVARELGWPAPVSWQAIQQRATGDPDFKWNHPATSHASGLLATLAEFYAGAGKTRGLTEADATAQSTLDYVRDIERTVKFYGEGELAVIERAQQEGPSFLDAFVTQEQLVVRFNEQGNQDRLVAMYPAEGTLWADHPLALLELPTVTANQRRTYQALREFLLSPEAQQTVLANGYRPADLSIALDSPGSPLTAANGVNPQEPQTTLQIPSPAVVEVVQNAWYYTKRLANVFLVVDTSGSMRGEKLAAAQEALQTFLDQIVNDRERIGMIEFSDQVNHVVELDELANNRDVLQFDIDNLQAGGNTALLDAVRAAYRRMQREGDPERINAIVAMTDGRENQSAVTLNQLVREINQGNAGGVPVIVFSIAYGDDADYDILTALANASGGQVREGSPETIQQLYKILSSYF
jgi:Ca-activated chloride channel family protein